MTIIFIHGAGCTPDVFAAQMRAFPDGLAPTLPGHRAPGAPASVAAFADALAPIVRGVGGDVVLCGSSMGGAIALELALRAEPGVRAVVTVGSGARLRVAPALLQSLADDFEAAARGLAPIFFAEPKPAWVEAAVAGMLEVGQAQTLRDFRACDAFDCSARLGEIAVPTLALVGEFDRLTPVKHSAFLADRIPNGQTRILPQTGHLATIEAPEATNAALRQFVATL